MFRIATPLKSAVIAALAIGALTGTGAIAGDNTADERVFALSDASAYLLPEAEEIALARSAGPAAVSTDATVLVLKADGEYRTAVEGSNGWTCLTGRSWTGPAAFTDGRRQWSEGHFSPAVKAPQCFNAESRASLVAMHRLTTRMFMQGANTAEVDLAVGRALSSGEIAVPEAGAMSYMLSPQQVLTPDGNRFMPHLMFYTPFASQASYGAREGSMSVPMVTDGGSVFATTVLFLPQWSDGSPAMGG